MNAPEITQQFAHQLTPPAIPGWFRVPGHWPAQTDLLGWCQQVNPGLASLLILLGVIYLLFGFKLFKGLVMLNAAAVGAIIGFLIGQHTEMGFALMVLCGFMAAALAWPLMRWAVAIMGGLFGAVFGAAVWHSFGLDPAFTWSGALTGTVGFGLLSFILFRGSVTMYMSLQGSIMLIFGVLGMIYKYQEIAPKVTHTMTLKPFLLPMAILIPMIIGMLYQQGGGEAAAPAKK